MTSLWLIIPRIGNGFLLKGQNIVYLLGLSKTSDILPIVRKNLANRVANDKFGHCGVKHNGFVFTTTVILSRYGGLVIPYRHIALCMILSLLVVFVPDTLDISMPRESMHPFPILGNGLFKFLLG